MNYSVFSLRLLVLCTYFTANVVYKQKRRSNQELIDSTSTDKLKVRNSTANEHATDIGKKGRVQFSFLHHYFQTKKDIIRYSLNVYFATLISF